MPKPASGYSEIRPNTLLSSSRNRSGAFVRFCRHQRDSWRICLSAKRVGLIRKARDQFDLSKSARTLVFRCKCLRHHVSSDRRDSGKTHRSVVDDRAIRPWPSSMSPRAAATFSCPPNGLEVNPRGQGPRAEAKRRTACLHVSRAMQAARRRAAFDSTSRLGRRAEAGPCQLLRRVGRRISNAHALP